MNIVQTQIIITRYILPLPLPLFLLFIYVSSSAIAEVKLPEVPKRPTLAELSKSLSNLESPKELSASDVDQILHNDTKGKNEKTKEKIK